jgi:membrane protease YdiL (CAAX protease family)
METGGEYALGLTARQSHMTVLFGVYSLAAAFLEELIFRGYLVVENRGRAALLTGIVGASLAFALLHPFLWEWQEGHLALHGDGKAWFSTAMIFAGSLWFYAVRFLPANPTRSLLPCIAAHAAKNLGVWMIKYGQGFATGWW